MLLPDVNDSFDDMRERPASACVDPLLHDRTNAGIYFEAAKHALDGLHGTEADDFQAFLINLPTHR